MIPNKHLPALALLCALIIGGCGGSSSSSGPLTHSQLVSKANGVCAQRNAKIAGLPRSFARITTLKDLATYLGDLESINQPLLSQLYSLKPPAADKAVWNDALNDNRRISQLITQAKTAAQAGNAAGVRQIENELAPINQSLHTDAATLGLTECLKIPVPSA